jgi:hypothetical protein
MHDAGANDPVAPATECMIEPSPSEHDLELAAFETMLADHEHQLDLTLADVIELLEVARAGRADLGAAHASHDDPQVR